jgi:hypothetical protein
LIVACPHIGISRTELVLPNDQKILRLSNPTLKLRTSMNLGEDQKNIYGAECLTEDESPLVGIY